jgi:hypothetical protein
MNIKPDHSSASPVAHPATALGSGDSLMQLAGAPECESRRI